MKLTFLFAALFVGHANCKVVDDSNFEKCRQFFYKGTPPTGFDESLSKICQTYKDQPRFATLYNTLYRIPVYSAYTLRDTSSRDQPKRMETWFVEPQLSDRGNAENMELGGGRTNEFKGVQAINADFRNTNYDRGHLNPNSYQSGADRNATFTLTNAVPQDPCLNRLMWYEFEATAKRIMTTTCSFDGARRYFVTGAVPTSRKIPSRSSDEEGDQVREYNRVSVPSLMWTAACCDSSEAHNQEDRNNGFSFAYFGENEPDSYVRPVGILYLEEILQDKYNLPDFTVFNDLCFAASENTKKALRRLRAILHKKVADTVLDLSVSGDSSMPASKRRMVQGVDNTINNNPSVSQRGWTFLDADFGMAVVRSLAEEVRNQLVDYGLRLVLSKTNFKVSSNEDTENFLQETRIQSISSAVKSDGRFLQSKDPEDRDSKKRLLLYFKKQHTFQQYTNKSYKRIEHDDSKIKAESLAVTDNYANLASQSLQETFLDNYVVVPSISNTLSAMGDRCRDGHACDKHGENYYWCYIDWSNNWDYCCINDCIFDGQAYQWCHTNSQSDWAYCSPPYSMMSIKNRTCLQDHQCGLHNKKYFWCYTDLQKNWEYCCQPWHDCLTHDKSYKWCYTDFRNETQPMNCTF